MIGFRIVEKYASLSEAIRAGADIVMLDNFDGPGIHVAAQSLKARGAASGSDLDLIWEHQKDFLIEGSDRLTEHE
ncbi:hypothetical protein BASA50_009281 [Batrachochytrium salamandrivorans]|uniref:Quinolinate phosphoribosyl transferase C-terminal domain-containing protein n=1 Tax=Batrachochytrium salamandrivorans TaxID=1357716 RepID=A0ABQ8F1T2_9FUNG|nr:hypothetical protein BASA62_005170 [Batrachochytrium salamandrivorans]KAH6579736.1 hypothetical protein BASA60_003161 [Batrachochytrium salamandrivorans]KAH6590562.1 hypothetical protein BASA50_009281 [Batrachochytrium salamandrivorans]KAH9265225.1 hypothetical protein BASA83_011225 [Batrachochytrium salamandrivorans]